MRVLTEPLLWMIVLVVGLAFLWLGFLAAPSPHACALVDAAADHVLIQDGERETLIDCREGLR